MRSKAILFACVPGTTKKTAVEAPNWHQNAWPQTAVMVLLGFAEVQQSHSVRKDCLIFPCGSLVWRQDLLFFTLLASHDMYQGSVTTERLACSHRSVYIATVSRTSLLRSRVKSLQVKDIQVTNNTMTTMIGPIQVTLEKKTYQLYKNGLSMLIKCHV